MNWRLTAAIARDQGQWLLFILLSFALCMRGITALITHPDQMALLSLFKEGLAPFNPGWFEKPPFHTYTNYFLAVWPATSVASALNLSNEHRDLLIVVWSRLVSIALYLGALTLFYALVRRTFGSFTSGLLTALLATSAGPIAHVHFLTADIPVMAWMMAAFYFSHRILSGPTRLASYQLAGLFTGIATATKYNALAVGLAIPIAHYLRHYYLDRQPVRGVEVIFPVKLVLGVACVIVGFVIANPFSVLDYRTFVYDFVHNYKVAPVYEGQTGNSYTQFFVALIECVGVPGFVLATTGWIASCALAFTPHVTRMQKASIALAGAVVLLYYAKFAPFPRLETRFVLPIVPLAMFVPALAVAHLQRTRMALAAVVMSVAVYNVACAYVTGGRFNNDPRLAVRTWLRDNVPARSVVEADVYAPSWPKREDAVVVVVDMPFVSGRERLFKKLFNDDPYVVGTPDYYAQIDQMTRWYSATELAARKPDFLLIDSLYYSRFVNSGPQRDLYPSMGEFFKALLDQRLGYRIAFDQSTTPAPWWLYPRNLDFQQNRVTVLARDARSLRGQ